jgi:hypothetical protein
LLDLESRKREGDFTSKGSEVVEELGLRDNRGDDAGVDTVQKGTDLGKKKS